MSFSAYFVKKNKVRALDNVMKTASIDCKEDNRAYFNMFRSMQDLLEVMLEAEEGLNLFGDELSYSVRKTPFLFSDQDIYYLRQFPPIFWAQALSHRYNKMLADLHREYELAKRENRKTLIPEWDFVTVWDQGKPCTFLVNIMASQHYKRLTAPANKEKLATSDDAEARKQYEKDHGYYELELGPYVEGGHVRDDDEKDPDLESLPNPVERSESWKEVQERQIKKNKNPHRTSKESPPDRAWIFRGLVGMTKKRASVRVGTWIKSVADGWLSGEEDSAQRKIYDRAMKVDWRNIRGSGGRDRLYPLVVPVYNDKQIQRLNQIDNREFSHALRPASVSDPYFQPDYLFPNEKDNPHPLWWTNIKNSEELIKALSYEEEVKSCKVEADGKLTETQVPCRVWKALTVHGLIRKFVAPLPIMDRGLLVNNKKYREHEGKKAAANNIKSLMVPKDRGEEDPANKIVADLRLGVEGISKRINAKNGELARRGDKEDDDSVKLQDELFRLYGSLEIARHLSEVNPNWPQLADGQIVELLRSDVSYAKKLETEARQTILNAIAQKQVADEREFLKYTMRLRRDSLYHWINTGGASMNRGTKQYTQANKEVTDRYQQEHEKFFTQNDIGESGLPEVAAYPYDPAYIKKLLESDLASQRKQLEEQEKKREEISKVLNSPRSHKGKEAPSVLAHVMKHQYMPLDQIIDIDGEPLSKLSIKRTPGSDAITGAQEKLKWTEKIKVFKGEKSVNGVQKIGLGAYDLIREYQYALKSIRSIKRTIKNLENQMKGVVEGKQVTVDSPIAEGVKNFTDKIKGTPEYDAMQVGLNLLYESIRRYITRNLGEDAYDNFLKAERAYKQAKDQLEQAKQGEDKMAIKTANANCQKATRILMKKLEEWKTRIRQLAFVYSKCMWQLDLGFGTRRQRERGLKGSLAIADEENEADRQVQLTPSEERLAEELGKFLELDGSQNPDDLVRKIKDSIHSRMEGDSTSTGIDEQRKWLYRKIKGVGVADANWQQILEIGQVPEENGDEKEESSAQDFVHGLSVDDMITASWMKVGGRAFQLIRLGFIQEYKRIRGHYPTNREVQEYLQQQKTIVSRAVAEAGKFKEGEERNVPDKESELPVGHVLEKWEKITNLENKANQIKKMLHNYTKEQWSEYRRNPAAIRPLQNIHSLTEVTSWIVQRTRTKLVDLKILENAVAKLVGHITSEPKDKGELLKEELSEFTNFNRVLVSKEAPTFDLAVKIVRSLQNKNSYKIVHTNKSKATYWADIRNNASAARRWIDADIILRYKRIKIRFADGVERKWILSNEDVQLIQTARSQASNMWVIENAAQKFAQANPQYGKEEIAYVGGKTKVENPSDASDSPI